MNYIALFQSYFPSVSLPSEELLLAFVRQAKEVLKVYGIEELNPDGSQNLLFEDLVCFYIACQLQKSGGMSGGTGPLTSQTVESFSVGFGPLTDKYSGGIPNQGGYCDMFNYLAQQEALKNGSLSPIIVVRGRGRC